MEFYNYREHMIDDIREWIDGGNSGWITPNGAQYDVGDLGEDELRERLNDELWTVDDVTGNGSGSYWFSHAKAAEALAYNWDLMAEAMQEFCTPWERLGEGPEFADVTIRCYLLSECIDTVLSEWEQEGKLAYVVPF